ncbi:MFS transporter, CP family, cyanate transporter [Lentibacillus halodurans]|uniref:MFS transporter, CP family, cyanate transporter n=1 Tax=Lentibacillus halodurans TaxID=237679 RepID=A0A1I0X3B5_9BACI|nr:MFS transporter [Lentibacillus halodurans]SFA94856.1 MFS transporter, CP family, cyanate transporter [Lentibacillus halodurans]
MGIYQFENLKRYNQFLLIAGIIVIAFNLRAAITSVGPLANVIGDDLGLDSWSIGILTSLPLVAFAVMSPVAPKLGRKYSNEVVLIAGMAVLLTGLFVRLIPAAVYLFGGTLLIGLGIAVSNVLLPGVIKERFPNRIPLMTSVYSIAMGLMASLASGVSVPLADAAGLGWKISLAVWALPAIAGIVIWVYFVKQRRSANDVSVHYVTASDVRMWKSRLAWEVAAFLGLQAFLYYVVIAWLPVILQDYGTSSQTAGWMLSYAQFIGLPASLLPVVAGKLKSQSSLTVGICLLAFTGTAGLLLGQSSFMMITSVTLLGIATGGLFPLSLAFLGMRAGDAQQAAELSGMAQALGYFLAALGPIFIGYLNDLTTGWEVPLITVLVVTVLMAIVGFGAGRARTVEDEFVNMAERENTDTKMDI